MGHIVDLDVPAKTVWLAALLALAPAIAYAVPGTLEAEYGETVVQIEYDATDVTVTNVDLNIDDQSILFDVSVSGSPGILEITFERDFFDAVYEGTDDEFIIIVDGDEPDFEEIQTSDSSRTLRLELPEGSDEVEIFGSAFGEFAGSLDDDADTPDAGANDTDASGAGANDTDASGAGANDTDGTIPDDDGDIPDADASGDGDSDDGNVAGADDGDAGTDMTDPVDTAPVSPSADICGRGTALIDGVCVAVGSSGSIADAGRELVMGVLFALGAAFIVILFLLIIRKLG